MTFSTFSKAVHDKLQAFSGRKRKQLLRALERNQEQALAGMTVEQLQEELKKLG